MNPSSRTRCALVCAAFIGLFSIFSFRLIYLQAIKHDEYAGLAAEKHVYKQVIHAERGMILDANNEVLAHNIPVETVVADATHLSDVQATVDLLNAELEIPSQELAEKLNSGRRYIVIKREVPAARANALREKLRAGNLRGIYFEHDATRIYPNGSMLCHVIGFTDFDHHGVQGVEASMEEYLHGQDGYRFIEHNRAGQEIVPYRGQERASAGRLPGASDCRSWVAEHRRRGNRRGDEGVFSTKGDDHSDAAADRRNPGDRQPPEL